MARNATTHNKSALPSPPLPPSPPLLPCPPLPSHSFFKCDVQAQSIGPSSQPPPQLSCCGGGRPCRLSVQPLRVCTDSRTVGSHSCKATLAGILAHLGRGGPGPQHWVGGGAGKRRPVSTSRGGGWPADTVTAAAVSVAKKKKRSKPHGKCYTALNCLC